MKETISPPRSDKPTVADVAREARVALGTVSRVLNSPELVTDEIRRRVEDAIERLDYQPLRRRNTNGPTGQTPLFRRKTGCIGVLLVGMDDSLTHLPVISEAIHGVELAIAEADENLMLANVPGADRIPPFLSKGLVDGIVIKTPLLGDWRQCASKGLIEAVERFPLVWLIGQPDSAIGDVVASDNEEGARIAAKYLYARNHRRIAYLHPRPGQTRSENLKHAFLMQAQRLGMDLQFIEGNRAGVVRWPLPAITQPTDLLPLIERWESQPEAQRPTAIVVGADSIAVQLYKALQQRGLSVGVDVSVLSFNHEKPLVLGLEPSLTTIDIRAEAIGKRAVDQLRWRMDHFNDELSNKILVAPRLVEGGSVANLRQTP